MRHTPLIYKLHIKITASYHCKKYKKYKEFNIRCTVTKLATLLFVGFQGERKYNIYYTDCWDSHVLSFIIFTIKNILKLSAVVIFMIWHCTKGNVITNNDKQWTKRVFRITLHSLLHNELIQEIQKIIFSDDKSPRLAHNRNNVFTFITHLIPRW